jgi:S1-C subfamily serine protease
MKSSYLGRSNATVWPRPPPPRAALLLVACLFVVGCAPHWSGSIGAVLAQSHRDGRLYVREAPPDMGAAKAGVQPDDEVTAIDGKLVLGMSPNDVHNAVSGAVGTKVRLTVSRDGKEMTFDVERGPLRGE